MWSTLAPAVAVGAIVFAAASFYVAQRGQTPRIRARTIVLTVWMVSILVWPLVWAFVMGKERATLGAWVSLIWPILAIGADIGAMQQSTYEHAHIETKGSNLAIDSNAVCSLTFAISSIIGAQKHECCNRIFLYAVLGCIVFVMPTQYVRTTSLSTMTIEAVQKSVLAYSTALLIGGVLVVVSKNGNVLINTAKS